MSFYRPTRSVRAVFGVANPSVCLFVCLKRSCTLFTGLNFSEVFLHHIIELGPAHIHAKIQYNRPKGPSPAHASGLQTPIAMLFSFTTQNFTEIGEQLLCYDDPRMIFNMAAVRHLEFKNNVWSHDCH